MKFLLMVVAVTLAMWLSLPVLAQGDSNDSATVSKKENSNGSATESSKEDSTGAAVMSTSENSTSAAAESQKENSTDASSESNNSESIDKRDLTRFFAYLEDERGAKAGPLFELVNSNPAVRQFIVGPDPADNKFRPMVQWRIWADMPQPVIPSFFFCGFVAWLFWFVVPGLLTSASSLAQKEFWKSFFCGALVGAAWMTLIRATFMTHVGWPAGIVLVGLFQLWMLLGLAVAASLIGHTLGLICGLNKALAARPVALRIVEILIGAGVCALLLQVPSPGDLPRAGTRIVGLFALLGAGAFFRVLRQGASRISQSP